ncbi:MAG: hypothetical protein WAS93_04920 [Burkholderiaceae bacterium]
MKNVLRELVQSGGSGKASHTKFWANVAYAAATVCFVRFEWFATDPHIELWLVYLGTVAGVASVSKLLSLRYNANYNGMSDADNPANGGAS